jgi:hypothetical protein
MIRPFISRAFLTPLYIYFTFYTSIYHASCEDGQATIDVSGVIQLRSEFRSVVIQASLVRTYPEVNVQCAQGCKFGFREVERIAV